MKSLAHALSPSKSHFCRKTRCVQLLKVKGTRRGANSCWHLEGARPKRILKGTMYLSDRGLNSSPPKSSLRGFGLAEVLVTAGIMGFVAMMGAKMFTDQLKGSQTVGQKYDISSLESEIKALLSDSASCTANFHNFTLNNSATPTLPLQGITSLVNSTSNLLYATGHTWGTSGISITSLSFGGASLDLLGAPIPGRVNLTVNISKPNTYGGSSIQYVLSLVETPLAATPTKLDTCYVFGGTPPAPAPTNSFAFTTVTQMSGSGSAGYHKFCAYNGLNSSDNGRVYPDLTKPQDAQGRWTWVETSNNSKSRIICYD